MQYNVNNPSIKRILREVKEMEAEPSNQYHAAPLEENLFEWHFTIKGPAGTEFEGGLYHGRIILPPEYPFKPPNIVLLNPSGRFEVGTKICLSISSYHPEHWQPSWSIRTVLVALISFMPTKGEGAIGALDYPPEERKKLAAKTIGFACEKCGAHLCNVFPPDPSPATPEEPAIPTSPSPTTTISSPIPISDEEPPKQRPDNVVQPPSIPASSDSIHNNVSNSTSLNNNNNNNNNHRNNNLYNQHQHLDDAPVQQAFIPHAQPAAAHAQLPNNVAAMMHAPAAPVQVVHQGESAHDEATQMLDYVILAIVVAIVGLILRKMYYSTDV
jgi:ubiquitin-conjugating enzyme E2 J1